MPDSTTSAPRGDDGPGSGVELFGDLDDSAGLFALGEMRSTAEAIRALRIAVDAVCDPKSMDCARR